MRRGVLPWAIAVLLVVASTAGGVLAANAAVFSPTAFVQGYLDALQRGDTSGALALPGVRIGPLRTELLAASGLDERSAAHVVADRATAGGQRELTVQWRHTGRVQRTVLRVEADGVLGPFPQWRFAVSPIAAVRLEPRGGSALRVGGIRVDPTAVQRGTPVGARFAVAVPGAYPVDLRDRMLRADSGDLVASATGTLAPVRVTLEPTERFTRLAMSAVTAALADCAKQTVLFPTGCPFGLPVTDRLASTPAWSIADAPTVTLEPTDDPRAWFTRPAEGTAHLDVRVRSIFDGTVTELDRDVPFAATWTVRLDGDDVALGALRTVD